VSTFEIHRAVSTPWRKIAGVGVLFEKAASMLLRPSK